MASVTYKNQPAIDKTKGNVPLAGTRHVYTVKKVLWPTEVTALLSTVLQSPSLHVCCGHSELGDVRCDMDIMVQPDMVCDAAKLPFADSSFTSVLCDPPYNGKFQWNHDLLSELSRVASNRIIFQHWFIPANPDGFWKKWHRFRLSDVYVWQPRTYFGRVQAISVFDSEPQNQKGAILEDKPKKKRIHKEGFIEVTKTYIVNGKEKPKSKREKIVARIFATDTATVGVKFSKKIDTGNKYRPIGVDVFASVPCYAEEMHSAFLQVCEFAENEITDILDRIENNAEERDDDEE